MNLMPKEFIETVLIKEIGEIHKKHPYISFAIMTIGIEFLGKGINSLDKWNISGRSKIDFELSINKLTNFDRYKPLLTSHNLWDSLRNGFAHSFVPKKTISLSSKDETAHLENISSTQINLRCEDLYIDFANACKEVINMTFPTTDKMNEPLLSIPDISNGLDIDELNKPNTGTTIV